MNKSITALAVALATMSAHADLTTGDIAFTSFNADEDGWSLVTFVDIAANTTLYFTDNEWQGSAFNTGEGYQRWVSGPSTIAAGTVIRFSSIQTASRAASVGTLSGVSGSVDMAQTEEAIYAYLGTASNAPTTFLAAITNTAFGRAGAGTLTGTGLTGSGMSLGTSTTSDGADWAYYTGPRTGQTSMAGYKALVADTANWSISPATGSFASEVPNTTAFSVSAVPEPQTYALMLGGLGLVGWLARRRRAV